MQKDAAPHKSPVVLGLVLVGLPLFMGGAFAAVAFIVDLVPSPIPTGVDVGRSGISGILAGLAAGVAVVLQLRRGADNDR